jgi:hypothetical protein
MPVTEALEHGQPTFHIRFSVPQVPSIPRDDSQLMPRVSVRVQVADTICNCKTALEAVLCSYQIASVACHNTQTMPGVLRELQFADAFADSQTVTIALFGA